MAHTYAKTQTHTDRCEANSFPWWKLCRYLWDILGIWHVVRGKKCVCVVLLSAIQNSKVNSKNSIYVFVWLHVHRCMNASVVAALLNDNLATLLQVCVRVLMHTGAMCADFFYSCTRSRCLITWRVQINERLRGACFLSRPLYCTDKHEPLGFSTAAWLQKPRVIHSTFLKVRSVLKQTSLIPGDTTLSWQQGESLSNIIYFWFLWRFIYSNSHWAIKIPIFPWISQWKGMTATFLCQADFTEWNGPYDLILSPWNLSDIPTYVFQTMLCMYALTMDDLYNYLLKSNLGLQYLSRSMQNTIMLSVLLLVSFVKVNKTHKDNRVVCTISLHQIFTTLHIHSDTWF